MEKIIYFFILINFTLILSSNIISFELQYNTNFNNNNDISSIFSYLENIYIYSYVKIGDPEYKLKTNISVIIPHFFLSSNLEQKIENNKLVYDINKSKTFKNISRLNQYYVQSTEDISAKEKFIINITNLDSKQNKIFILNDMDFILGVRNSYQKNDNYSEVYFLTIGLQLYTPSKYSQEKQFNFIFLLKEKEIISNYNWFIYYEKINLENDILYNLDDLVNNKKNLWIGGCPHDYFNFLFIKFIIKTIFMSKTCLFNSFHFLSIFFIVLSFSLTKLHHLIPSDLLQMVLTPLKQHIHPFFIIVSLNISLSL